MIKITNGKFYTDKYVNVDTNIEHNLLIYEYSINNNHGYNIVIGEVNGDITELIEYLNRIMNLRITNSHLLFICSCINIAKAKNIFSNIKFSKSGYKIIFQNDYENQTYKYLSNDLKDITIDSITKKFSTISSSIPFYSIEYYENLVLEEETLGGKTYKKVINN